MPPVPGHAAGEVNFLDQLLCWYEEQGLDIVYLDDAIEELRELEPRWAEVVLLRFFGGYTIEETAELLAVSPRTINKDWKQTRAWLRVNARPSSPGIWLTSPCRF